MTEIYSGENSIENTEFDKNEINSPADNKIAESRAFPINPDNFNVFGFSKISHLNFFSSNNYDIEFFNMKIGKENINLKKYQILLIYSFICQNLKYGANILEISDRSESDILRYFRFRFDCYKTINVQNLEIKNSVKDRKVVGVKFDNKNSEEILKENSYDLVFCTSEFKNLTEDKVILNNITENINRLIKPGGFSLLCFDNIKAINNIWVHNLMFTIFNYSGFGIKTKNLYQDHTEILKDPDLLFIPKDFSKNPNVVSKQRKYKGKGNVFIINILVKKKSLELVQRTNSRNLNSINRSPVFIFHHLMKCGGSSIVQSLTKWFHIRYDLLEDSADLNSFVMQKYNLEDLFTDYCITGHFQYDGIYLHQRYPEMFERKNDFKIFTFIRDPLKIKISLYYYVSKFGGYKIENLTLKKNLLADKNFLASLFPCDESNYREVLDRYFFIGISEKMQESMNILADKLDKKRINVPVINTTQKDYQINDLTPEFLEIFKKRNKLDYMIYEYCLERFRKY